MSTYYADLDDDLAREATQAVRRHTNRVYSPVLSTSEVAAHIGVDDTTALEALMASHDVGYISRKEVGEDDDESYVWW